MTRSAGHAPPPDFLMLPGLFRARQLIDDVAAPDFAYITDSVVSAEPEAAAYSTIDSLHSLQRVSSFRT